MKNQKIDLQLIAQNLLSENTKIREYLDNEYNKGKSLNVTSSKLSAKYPSLKSLADTVLISFLSSDKGISIYVPSIALYDGEIALFDTGNKIWEVDYQIKEYKLDLILPSANILLSDFELVIKVFINDTCKSRIKKDDVITGKDNLPVKYLEEKTIFVAIKQLDLGKYKLVKNTKKRTKFNDLMVHLENIDTGEIIKYVAINAEVEKLISKYGKDTKFEITGHQNFVNDDGKNAVKTIIKDSNFTEDLSDLDLF